MGHTSIKSGFRAVGRRNRKKNSIQWKELYPIAVAAAIWDHLWGRRCITFMCDNEAMTHMIEMGTSKSPSIMRLLRPLFFCAAKHNFSTTAKHITGKNNLIADSLSHFNMQVFQQAAPEADQEPTPQTPLPCIDI